jgi:hypothetical protein
MTETSLPSGAPHTLTVARSLQAPAPIVVTAIALVTLGFCAAFALFAPLGASVAPGDPWPLAQAGAADRSIAFSVIGGILLGMPLAIHVLHRELARPLVVGEASEDASASRFVYAPGARRRMMLGLVAAYGTAALLALFIARTTDAASALRALLVY